MQIVEPSKGHSVFPFPVVVLFLLAIKRKSTKKKNRRSLWTLLKSTAGSHTQAKPVGTIIVPVYKVFTASLVACLLKALASEPALIFTQAPQMRILALLRRAAVLNRS